MQYDVKRRCPVCGKSYAVMSDLVSQSFPPERLTAVSVLRAWARWLPRLSGSSVPYLLENFIHRSGTLTVDAKRVLVEMDPKPLDVVIEMAGYTSDLERVDWLGGRNLIVRIRR